MNINKISPSKKIKIIITEQQFKKLAKNLLFEEEKNNINQTKKLKLIRR